jgi:hypothetical protein
MNVLELDLVDRVKSLPISNASALLNEPEAFSFLPGGHYVEGD